MVKIETYKDTEKKVISWLQDKYNHHKIIELKILYYDINQTFLSGSEAVHIMIVYDE
ncbi:MAG: hypothetical protein LUG12_12750 [Erysipelotrichaceae bacterium]|nr:hypothetical protein [Erysipelotrichaceae bacterium]